MVENCVWISFCSFSCLFLCVEYLEKESSATTCHWAHSVAEDHLELLIFLPLPPKCWEFIHTQPLSVLLCNFIIIIIIIHVHICLWIICTALCYFVYFQTHYDIFFFHSLRNFMDFWISNIWIFPDSHSFFCLYWDLYCPKNLQFYFSFFSVYRIVLRIFYNMS